jgi:thiamine kinase-like enzyme
VVSDNGRVYVLRLDDEHTAIFLLDRRIESKVRKAACIAGLAPRVIYLDINGGIVLSEFLAGSVWSSTDLASNRSLERLGARIRDVHALPLSGKTLDLDHVAGMYVDKLLDRPAFRAFAEDCQQLIASVSRHGPVVCCHNDMIADNIVEADRLMFLDWEYACDNDPLFDLASLICFHNLSDERADTLLDAYSGGSDAAQRERLHIQVRLFDAIQWLWYAVRHRISPNKALAARLEALQQRIG